MKRKEKLSSIEKTLKLIKDTENKKKKEARKKILNYYKKAPLHFLAIVGGWTIFIVILHHFIDTPYASIKEGVILVLLIYVIVFIVQFIKDIKKPENHP